MEKKTELLLNFLFGFVSLVLGVAGIAILIGIGESSNNSIVAFASVSIPFFVITLLFAFLAPRGWWIYAILISGPVAILSLIGSWSGGGLMLGALWTVGISLVGAYVGAKLRSARDARQQSPHNGS